MIKVAVVVSHPIQHFCPQYSSWSHLPKVDLKVFFSSQHGLKPYQDQNFGRILQWEGLHLNFPHKFLSGSETKELGSKIDSTDLESQLHFYSPDILIVYGYSQPLQRKAMKWANSNGVSVCMISDSELRTPRNLLKRFIKRFALPKLYRKVDLFFTVGDANEAYLRHYGINDNRMIRCFFPIDIEHYNSVLFNSKTLRLQTRKELKIPTQHKVVLCVGKLVPWKRQLDLVLASNTLQGKRDDVTIILAGSGSDEENLRRICKNEGPGGVIFAGFIPPKTLPEFYCAADVYAHCSEHEPHSLAISEAIYCGLPVVLSDRCGSYGPSDDIRPGFNGFVYRCGDVDNLTQQLEFIINSNEIRYEMSKRSTQSSRFHQKLAHGEALQQALLILKKEQFLDF